MAKAPEKMSSPDEQSVGRVKKILSIIDGEGLLGTFLENRMTDDVLTCAETKEEMQSWLKNIVPLGVAIKFSVKWFKSFTHTIVPTDSSDQSVGATAVEGKVMGTSNIGEEPNVASSDQSVGTTAVEGKVMGTFNVGEEPINVASSDQSVGATAVEGKVMGTSNVGEEPNAASSDQSVGATAVEEKMMGTSNVGEEPNVASSDQSVGATAVEGKVMGTSNVGEEPNAASSDQSVGTTAVEEKMMGTSNVGEEPNAVSLDSSSEISSSRTLNDRDSVAVHLVPDDNLVTSTAKDDPGGTKAQLKNKARSRGGRTDHLGANLPQKEQQMISVTNADPQAAGVVVMTNVTPVQHQSQAEASTAETRKSTRRPFGEKDFKYSEGEIILGEENAEIEFKSLTKENSVKLPWKIMEKARPFLCGVLNAGGSGVIYFGIGDSYDKSTQFTRGEVIGLDVENLKDEIIKAFQFTLDDHIKSNDGKLQKAGDMGCIKIFFVPVYKADQPTGRYVVELEVKRDWQHCKKNVYYHQSWKEKRGDCKKGGLHDLYKVDKDDWQDPVVRTCGATITVKNIEVEKQIRAPLSQKYNAFLDQEKKSFLSTTPPDIDGADVQSFSSNLRESLRELNFKEFSYILIANKISQKYRGTDTLAFLQSVPWMVVFDLFDPGSWEDGLHYIFSETSNSFQASFKDLSKLQDDIANENFPARGTTWVERNEEMAKRDWIRHSKSLLNHALSACKGTPTGRLHFVFLLSSNENVVEMADMMETAFSILGEKASKSITIISEETQVLDEIIKNSKQDVRNDVKRQSYSGKRWDLIKEIFERLLPLGSIDSNPQAKTALPYFDGKLKDVLTGKLNSLTDLEIYLPNLKIDENVEEIKRAKNDFYKGGSVNQVNLFHRHDIDRTLQKRLTREIDRCLKKLSEHSELADTVEVVQLRYESGSGATTLCRRILWNKKDTYRCAEVKAITGETDYQIEQLHDLSYNLSQCYIPPVLVLVDNFSDQDVRQLHNKISERMITCVILNTIPISKSQNSNKEFLELRQLDPTEIQKVKGILESMTIENKIMCKAEEVLERDRRFLWLGLELFGRKYQDVDRKVTNQIEDMIAQNVTVDSEYKMILNFCCLLDSYSWGRCNYPHAIVSDLLCAGKGENDIADLIPELHEKYGGLLLETQDERNGNWCWRPAHYLVGEIVKNKMDLIVTTKHFLKTMNDGNAYAIKFLRDHAVTICLDRLSTTTSPVSSNDEDLEDALIVNDTCGGLKVRSKYSPLIQDVIELAGTRSQEGIENVLDILVTLCENVKTIPHKARTWQQIARIIAYELGASDVSSETGKIRYLNDLLRPTEKATKGFEIAHLVIDEAIRLQDTHIHHFTAKGAFFLCELNQIEERLCTSSQQITAIVKEAINTGRKGVEMYENALQKIPSDSYGYLDVLVGKFVAVVKLLEVLKCLPYFKEHSLGQDKSFSAYMHGEIPHEELSAVFDTRVSEYLVSLKDVAAELSIDLSQEIHFVKLRHPDVSRKYLRDEVRNVRIRASEITKKFYCLTGWDEWDQTNVPPSGGYEEFTSHYLLSKRGETAFSSWKTLYDDDVQKIHDSLQPTIHNPKTGKIDASMLIFAKALLYFPEKTTLSKFSEHIKNWCQMFPSSVWAHFFNYMIHFPPIANSPFAEEKIIKDSIGICTAKSRTKQRRSGAEYLLGKGVGLKAIVRACEITKTSDEIYGTKFWQSPEVFTKLERLQGRKTGKGLLRYKGIEIKFDNRRYPKESEEELWFYLGFTLSGPYAFDPIDKNSYENLKATLSEAEVMEKKPSTDRKPGASATSYSQRPTKISKPSNQRESVPKDESNQPKVPPKVVRNQGGDQHCFPFTRFDSYGRACHGAQVKAARKSVDCNKASKGHNIETCSFAHYARGDTLQHVCRKCTKNDKRECTEKKKHQEDIYNLGPFLDQNGNVWVKHA